ncbi:MAG: hypothetical protein AAF218_11215 [Pseudomonadota bacterium]
MPHAELKYSAGLDLDAAQILRAVEDVLQARDPGSGDCKGRAYPAPQWHHHNVLLDISMLPKAHRDADWLAALRADLVGRIAPMVPRPCWLSIELRFSGAHYYTEQLT